MTAQLSFGPEPPVQYPMVWEVRLETAHEVETPYYVADPMRASAEAVDVVSLPLMSKETPDGLRERLSDHLDIIIDDEWFEKFLCNSFHKNGFQKEILRLIFQSDLKDSARVSIAPMYNQRILGVLYLHKNVIRYTEQRSTSSPSSFGRMSFESPFHRENSNMSPQQQLPPGYSADS